MLLNRQGVTVGLFNLPVVTHPPRPLAGWMTSGDMLYPQRCYPAQLQGALERYPDPDCPYDYPPEPVTEADARAKHDAIFAEFTDRAEVGCRNLIRLLDWLEPEVMIAYWHHLDSIQHHLLYDEERTDRAYGQVDGLVGALIDRCEPHRVVVVSDHGMRLPVADDGGALVEMAG